MFSQKVNFVLPVHRVVEYMRIATALQLVLNVVAIIFLYRELKKTHGRRSPDRVGCSLPTSKHVHCKYQEERVSCKSEGDRGTTCRN